MPQLLDLPNETLLQIIASTHVEDIESFSSCNKHMRWLFGHVLQLHVERKRKYSKAEFGCSYPQPRFPHAVMLLRDVLESPAIAKYPTKIVIGACIDALCDWPDWSEERREEGKTEISSAIAQCKDMLSDNLDGCPYIRQSHKQDWKREIAAGDEYTVVAFLVTSFPNLKSITISDARFFPERLVEVVSKIATAQHKFPEIFHPLQNLTTVRLGRCGEIIEACYDILEPFAELQSVRILTGKEVQGWGCYWDNEDPNESDDEDDDESEDPDEDDLEDENRNENKDDGEDEDENEDECEYKIVESGGGITCLSFEDSAIDAESFDMVLRGTKALRNFKYNYDFSISTDGGVKWEPAAILRSLLFYAGHSLVSLDLTGTKGSWDVCVGDSPYSTNCPRHFQRLKRLYVQDGIFVEEMDVLKHPRSADRPWRPIERTTWRNYRMVDILPASLEELTLFPSFDHGDRTTNAFEGFLELKESRLPRLKDITLVNGLQLDENVKLACKKVGTSVMDRSY